MALIDRRGRNIPFFVESFTYESIATTDFDPITSGSDATGTLNASKVGDIKARGFLVRPDTDGALYGITHRQYIDATRNGGTLAGLLPQKYLGVANSWIEVPFVKVFAGNGSYQSTSSYINVAPI